MAQKSRNGVTRRSYLKISGSTAAGTAIAGCLGSGGEGSPEELDVLLTYLPDQVYAPTVFASDQGYWEDVGLDVDWDFTLETAGLELLATGEVDILAANAPGYPLALEQGLDLRATHTIVSDPGLTFAALPETGIETPNDLPGNTLGRQNVPDRDWYIPGVYDAAGLTDEQIEEIETTSIGFDVSNVLEGVVDVQTLFPTNSDFNSLQLAGEELDTMEVRDYIDVHGTFFLTRDQLAEDNPDIIREFVRAHAKAIEDTLDESMRDMVIDSVLDALDDADANVFLRDMDPREVQELNWERFTSFRPHEEWDTNGLGWTDPEAVANTIDLGIARGDLEDLENYDISDIIDNRFVDEVHDSNGNLEW